MAYPTYPNRYKVICKNCRTSDFETIDTSITPTIPYIRYQTITPVQTNRTTYSGQQTAYNPYRWYARNTQYHTGNMEQGAHHGTNQMMQANSTITNSNQNATNLNHNTHAANLNLMTNFNATRTNQPEPENEKMTEKPATTNN